MFDYEYTKVNGGYRWNLLQRVFNTIGLEPTNLSDIGESTFLSFSRELTPAEKLLIDAIMADNPTRPPTSTNTVYILKDIWETRQEFSTKLGNLPFKIYYSESVPNSNVFDRIELHFAKILGAAERNKVVDEQSKLMTLK